MYCEESIFWWLEAIAINIAKSHYLLCNLPDDYFPGIFNPRLRRYYLPISAEFDRDILQGELNDLFESFMDEYLPMENPTEDDISEVFDYSVFYH